LIQTLGDGKLSVREGAAVAIIEIIGINGTQALDIFNQSLKSSDSRFRAGAALALG
jgi:hypothetical protein